MPRRGKENYNGNLYDYEMKPITKKTFRIPFHQTSFIGLNPVPESPFIQCTNYSSIEKG
jgi:hypothetical protein